MARRRLTDDSTSPITDDGTLPLFQKYDERNADMRIDRGVVQDFDRAVAEAFGHDGVETENTTPETPQERMARMHRIARERREQGIEIVRRTPAQKAADKPTSLRLAITAKCWDCMGQNSDPNVRARIRDCPCEKTCSLFPVRPYQKAKSRSEDEDLEDENDESEVSDGE